MFNKTYSVLLVALLVLSACGGTAKGPALSSLTLPETQGNPISPESDSFRRGFSGRPLRDTYSPPVQIDDVLYIGREDALVALQPSKNYKKIWEHSFLDMSSGPAISADVSSAYISNFSGTLRKISLDDGAMVWETFLEGELIGGIVVANDFVAVRTSAGSLYLVQASTGELVWSVKSLVPTLSLRGVSKPVLFGRELYMLTDDCTLKSYNVNDGSLTWQSVITRSEGVTDLERLIDGDGDPLLIGSILYTSCVNGPIVAHSLSNKRVLWQTQSSSVKPIFSFDDYVLSIEVGDVLSVYDRLSGVEVWKNEELTWRDLTQPIYIDDKLIFGDAEGYMHVLDANTGVIIGRSRPFCSKPSRDQYAFYSARCAAVRYVWVEGEVIHALDNAGRIRLFSP